MRVFAEVLIRIRIRRFDNSAMTGNRLIMHGLSESHAAAPASGSSSRMGCWQTTSATAQGNWQTHDPECRERGRVYPICDRRERHTTDDAQGQSRRGCWRTQRREAFGAQYACGCAALRWLTRAIQPVQQLLALFRTTCLLLSLPLLAANGPTPTTTSVINISFPLGAKLY
jgi:hypothetical protein